MIKVATKVFIPFQAGKEKDDLACCLDKLSDLGMTKAPEKLTLSA